MTLHLNLSSYLNTLIINDLTKYKDEGNDLLIYDGSFRYIDLMSVDILIYHSEQSNVVKKILFSPHTFNDDKTTYIEIPDDGYLTVIHLELPTKEFINSASNINKHRMIYTDGKKFYERYLGFDDELSIETLVLLVNDLSDIYNLVLSSDSFQYVSTWFSEQNYISLLTDELTNSTTGKSKVLNKNIQILRTYLDTVKYLCNHHLPLEASRFINLIKSCKNLYNNPNYGKSKCGCSA